MTFGSVGYRKTTLRRASMITRPMIVHMQTRAAFPMRGTATRTRSKLKVDELSWFIAHSDRRNCDHRGYEKASRGSRKLLVITRIGLPVLRNFRDKKYAKS